MPPTLLSDSGELYSMQSMGQAPPHSTVKLLAKLRGLPTGAARQSHVVGQHLHRDHVHIVGFAEMAAQVG